MVEIAKNKIIVSVANVYHYVHKSSVLLYLQKNEKRKNQITIYKRFITCIQVVLLFCVANKKTARYNIDRKGA